MLISLRHTLRASPDNSLTAIANHTKLLLTTEHRLTSELRITTERRFTTEDAEEAPRCSYMRSSVSSVTSVVKCFSVFYVTRMTTITLDQHILEAPWATR